MYILKTRYLLLICTLLYLVGVQAQNPEKKQLPREVPSPERVATKMTDEMKRDLQLSEKQYDKIYDLNLKEQKIVFENVLSHPALGNEERPQMGEHPNFGGEHDYRISKLDANGNPEVVSISSYETENYLVSFFGRLNYSVLDKYLLTFTIRDDGSSRFHKDNRWGIFPSVALACFVMIAIRPIRYILIRDV